MLLISEGKMVWGISSCNLSWFTACNDECGVIKWMFQHHRCCAFDSRVARGCVVGSGGLGYGLWGTTP